MGLWKNRANLGEYLMPSLLPRCTMMPSMKQGIYHVYVLLGRAGELATVERAYVNMLLDKLSNTIHVIWYTYVQ